MSDILHDIIRKSDQRRADSKRRYDDMDGDLCMMCHAYGADKRSLIVRCFYDVSEIVPEAIDLGFDPEREGFFLRICKACRAEFLGHMREWAAERRRMRDVPKDHDGHPEEYEPERNIPVRINGATVMLTREEFDQRRKESLGGE